MFNTQEILIYYLRDCFTNEDTKIGNFNDLITFLVKGCRFDNWHKDKIYNKYFENLNCTSKDFSHHIEKHENKNGDEPNYDFIDVYTIKQFLFYDNNYRIIDIRKHKNIVFEIFKKSKINTSEKENNFIYGETYYKENWCGKQYYKYRQGAVPGIHKKRYGHYYKHPKVKQKLILASIPEYKEYVHPKENKTKFYWWDDYGLRYRSKSWKDNKKIKHQWQKNKKESSYS